MALKYHICAKQAQPVLIKYQALFKVSFLIISNILYKMTLNNLLTFVSLLEPISFNSATSSEAATNKSV